MSDYCEQLELFSQGFNEVLKKRSIKRKSWIQIDSECKEHFVTMMQELHDIREHLSTNDLRWCECIADYAKKNLSISSRQYDVIMSIHDRYAE